MSKIGEDFVAFSRVLSSALLLCGFIVFGVVVGRALVSRGYPGWTLPAVIVLGTLFGAWQAWNFLKSGIRGKRERKP